MNNTFHEFPAAILSATNLTLLSVVASPLPLFRLFCFSRHMPHSDLSFTPIGEIPDTISGLTKLRQLFAATAIHKFPFIPNEFHHTKQTGAQDNRH